MMVNQLGFGIKSYFSDQSDSLFHEKQVFLGTSTTLGIDLEVQSEKDLGVMIVKDTSWKEHIVTIVAKALIRCWIS